MPFRQSASSYIDSTRLLRKLKEKYPDWAKNDSNFQIEFDEDKDITTWCTPIHVANMLYPNSSISEKLDGIAPLQCFHESPPDHTVTVVSMELDDAETSTTSPAESCHPVKQSPKHPDDYLKLSGIKSNPAGTDYVSRIIFLTQSHSFRPLNLTEEAMKTMIQKHEINTQFLDTASAFCSKISRVEESLCMPFWMKQSGKYLEYMYIFKYPEQSTRRGKPWSIRQTALYHQLRRSDGRSTYVLISPYPETEGQKAVMAWLLAQKSAPAIRERAFGIHDVLFNCYMSNHRTFAAVFEEKIEDLSRKMLSFGLRDIHSVTPQDMADLNHIQAKLLPQRHALAGSQRALDGLDRAFKRWSQLRSRETEELSLQWEDMLDSRRGEIEAYKADSDALDKKCAIALQLLTSILDFNNRTISDLHRRIATKQSDKVSLLTQFTVNDSITVRVVTAISLVFLCVATIAAIMDTPFFDVNPDTGQFIMYQSTWIFALLCVLLTGVTLGYWRWSMARKKRERLRLMAYMTNQAIKLDDMGET